MSKQERIDFFKQQVDLENTIFEKAENAVKDLQNVLIRELILSIAFDSKKHAGMLNGLISLHSVATPSMAEEIGENLKSYIAEHIKLEEQAIKTYQEYLETVQEGNEKLIINAIFNDELRHHKLLKTIQKKIVEGMTLSEKDLWDMIEESYYDFGE